jgi:V8-like Glu-specific endopeptidase
VRAATGALEPDRAVVVFDALPGAVRREYRIAKVCWTSPPAELDVTIARLDDAIPCDAVATTATDPPANDGKQRVYIIGHPGGGVLRISLYDNELLDYDARRLHYHASTEKGSSGSPVFDDTWRLIGVHHAGPLPGQMLNRLNGKAGQYEANEGIRIDRIAGVARW